MYQVGLCFHAGFVTLWVKESVEIGTCDMAMNSACSRGISAAKSAAKCSSSIHQLPLLSGLNALDACDLFDRRTALTFIESKCGNIDKRRHVRMIACLGDDRPAVAMADQNHRSAHSVDCGLRVLLVVGVRGLWGLRH